MSLNKPTNVDKISSLFGIVSFPLPEQFVKALKYRDKYLHGSLPKNEQNIPEEYENFRRKFELQFLVNILTLKFINYHGYLRNTCAFMEYYSQIEKGIEKGKVKQNTSFYYEI